MLRLLKHSWRVISSLLILVGLIYLGPDLLGLPAAFAAYSPMLQWLAMANREHLLIGFCVLLLLWLTWIDIGRPLWRKYFGAHQALTDEIDVLTAAERALLKLNERLDYVRRVRSENSPSALENWRRKIDDQRVPFDYLDSLRPKRLSIEQKRNLERCRTEFKDFDRCVDNSTDSRRLDGQVAGMYQHRAEKFAAALRALVNSLSPAVSPERR